MRPALVLGLALGLVAGLLLEPSGAQAQPVTPNCTPYGVCSVKELRAKSARINGALTVDGGVTATSFAATSGGSGAAAVVIPNLDLFVMGSCYSQVNGANLNLGSGSGCNAIFTGGTQMRAHGIWLATQAAASSFTAPATLSGAAVLAGETNTGRTYASNGSRWTEVGGGQHPTMQGVSFTAASDRTAGANPPYWVTGPRAGGALVTFTSAGLASGSTGSCTAIGQCSSTPITVLTTTAVAGNQAHLSGAAAWFGPVSRFSTRVAPNPTSATSTSTRVFVGLSSALPLTAGSATPTAHAAVFRWDTSAGDTTWQACTGAGVAITCTDTGVAISTSTDLTHVLEIDCRPQSGFFPSSCTFWVDGRARVTRTTNLPAAAVGPTFSVETLTAAGRGLNFDTFTIETRG